MDAEEETTDLILGEGVPGSFRIDDSLDLPTGLVPVAVFRNTGEAGEYGLAILAMGKPYWTVPVGEVCVLCAHAKHRAEVRAEVLTLLRTRADDHRRRPAATEVFPEAAVSWISFALYPAVLIAFFSLQQRSGGLVTDLGRMDAVEVVSGGQWWRCITALTLHGDLVHLVSNLVSGLGFAFFAARFFGAPTAWALILVSGIAGNALTAWVYAPDPHFSIGASTAVFGALGLITGIGLRHAFARSGPRLGFPQWTVPAVGGLTLLGLLGTGSVEVDVAAHISGFFAGTALGVAGSLARRRGVPGVLRNRLLEAFPLLCLALAWISALAAG